MIIYNFKLNKKAIFKTVLVIMTIICLSIGVASIYKVLSNMKKQNNNLVEDSIPSSEVAKLTAENYTNILKQVHEDIDTYIGQKISFSGYVYRVSNFTSDQFVLARDMDIGNKQTLIVGFLCSLDSIKDFKDYTWVTITGEITKGTYNNADIPIIKVTQIEKASKPENPNVTLPDDEYVPTAVIY